MKEQQKYRNEIKYLCSEQELCLIEHRIRNLCASDPHAGEDHVYTVRSVYFDDYQDSCYHDNACGVDRREKFRIRLYNGNADKIFLECKEKVHGKNHKTICALDREQCKSILRGDFSLQGEADPLLYKFFTLYRTRLYRPKVIVEYERTPYLYKMGNVRITLDRNISAATAVQDFLNPRIARRPVMEAGRHLLEVKYDEFLPDYLYNELLIGNLQQTAFSKYYISRRLTQGFGG